MPSLRLVPFSEDNADLVLAWRNTSRVRENMIDDSVISMEEHLRFLETLAKDACRQYFVVYLDQDPVATLYFADLGQQEVTWGCYIGTEQMVPGLFVVLFLVGAELAFARPQTKALCSEVAAYNSAPQALNRFIGLGAGEERVRTTRSGRTVEFVPYRLERSGWASVQARALKVTPGSMKQAYNDWKAEI